MSNTVAPWETRCNYLSSPKCIDAIERYLAYRLAHGLGTTVKRAEYRGFHRDPPLILSRTGYPYRSTKKRRTNDHGEVADYWAADSLQAYVTGACNAVSSLVSPLLPTTGS